jgi:hypothetical protein
MTLENTPRGAKWKGNASEHHGLRQPLFGDNPISSARQSAPLARPGENLVGWPGRVRSTGRVAQRQDSTSFAFEFFVTLVRSRSRWEARGSQLRMAQNLVAKATRPP